MSDKKQVRLAVNLHASGRHDAAWKQLPNPETLTTNIDDFIRIAQLAEKGKFDAIFLADTPGGLPDEASVRPWRALDPIALLSALATATRHIGLVATASAVFGHPSVVARQIASLDHVSKGRAAWNIITSQNPQTLDAFGLNEGFEQSERYARAAEFVEIVHGLWGSVPREAIVADLKTHLYLDPKLTRPLNHEGKYHTVKGTMAVPSSVQGRPVVFQAGTSEESKDLGARWADALFTGQRTIEGSKAFYSDVKARAQAYGRNPDDLLVLPGLFPVIGSTHEEAQRRKDELDGQLDIERIVADLAVRLGLSPEDLKLDEPLPYELASKSAVTGNLARRHRDQLLTEARTKGLTTRQVVYNNVTGGHRITLGTPEEVADDILAWVDAGAADGFTLNTDVQTSGLENFVNLVIPILQKRGRFRTEYTGQTLRENLGLSKV